MKKLWLLIVCGIVLFYSFEVSAKQTSYTTTKIDIFTSIEKAAELQPFSVLVKISPINDWHIYWNNPGDAGVATRLKVSSDFGDVILKKQSTPQHFIIQDIIHQFAYEKPAYWLFEVIPDNKKKKKSDDKISLSFDISWQACKEECIAESMSKTLVLPVENTIVNSENWEKELFLAQKTFPNEYKKAYFTIKDNKLLINVPDFKDATDKIEFIPEIQDAIVYEKTQNFTIKNNILIVELPLSRNLTENKFKAIILTDNKAFQVDLTKNENLQSVKEANNFSLLTVLLMAFAGGLILNLMPCIFPILFLKAMSLLQNTYSYRKVSIEAIMYFVGVVVSFVLLAGCLYILRLSGENIGWGFQLQSPWFVAIMFGLFLIIALMFLDLIKINIPIFNRLATVSTSNEKINSFLTGLFAVLIASPCSAPFMGIAIGYSVTQTTSVYFAIFITLAIGYALPFTLLGLFPQKLAKILPKPGKWMIILKKIFAIPMLLTCMWLAWVFINQTNVIENTDDDKNITWQTFSEEKLESQIKTNIPTLLVFTAKWCLTCLVNEKTVFNSDEFAQIIKNKNITLLKADWTTQNDTITQVLEKYDRNSVPLYVYYNGKQTTPKILPQILTKSSIKSLLD